MTIHWQNGFVLVAAFLFSLFLVSCGGDDDDTGRVGTDDDDSGATDDDSSTADDDADDDTSDDDADDDTGDDDTGDDDDFGLTWIPIDAGEFDMGCSSGDDLCLPTEFPVHRVKLTKDFFILETEVTQEQYLLVIGNNPSYNAGCDDCPVENVDYEKSSTFCSAVGGRLPTEAEWEYAARAGALTRFNCGNEWSCLDDIAWYSEEGNELDVPKPVKQKEPNAWGLYDMLGNVSEWVYDGWDEDFYEGRQDPDVDPKNPPGIGNITRGGSYYIAYKDEVRLSFRIGIFADSQSAVHGFRCVKDVDE